MPRPNPIQYAERLYAAIRAANFSPISFLAFGNAVKEGVELRRMPRIAAEPFMRVVGDMLDLEESTSEGEIIETQAIGAARPTQAAPEFCEAGRSSPASGSAGDAEAQSAAEPKKADGVAADANPSGDNLDS